MIYTAEDPGNWAIWKKQPNNKDLPLQEATQKYRKEKLLFESQYMDFVQQQQAILSQNAQTSGTILNGVKSVAFDTLPIFKTNIQNLQTLTAKFAKPVLITGQPQVGVVNNQAGGGTQAAFTYTYTAGSGTTNIVFTHNHPLQTVALQGFSANIIAGEINLQAIAGAGTADPTGTPQDATYNFSSDTGYTTDGDGKEIGLTVVIVGGGFQSVTSTTPGKDFIPGEIITFNNNTLGAGSIGGTISIGAGALTPDIASFAAASAVTLNGGTITTVDQNVARRQGTPALDFASNSTKIGDPS